MKLVTSFLHTNMENRKRRKPKLAEFAAKKAVYTIVARVAHENLFDESGF